MLNVKKHRCHAYHAAKGGFPCTAKQLSRNLLGGSSLQAERGGDNCCRIRRNLSKFAVSVKANLSH